MKTPPFGAPEIWQDLAKLSAAADHPPAFQARLSQALAHVTEWRWANDDFFNPTPFHQELYKAPTPKWKKAPTGSGNVHHGLDATETVWILRRWPSAYQENCSQRLIERRPGVTDCFAYLGNWPEADLTRAPKTVNLKGLHRYLVRPDGQLAMTYSLSDHAPAWNDYQYEHDRLVRSVFHADHPEKGFVTRREYFYTYAADGTIEEIRYEHYLLPEGRLVEKKVAFKRKAK